MRKLTGVLLAGAMAVSLAACGQAEEKSNTSKKAETEQTKEQTPENVMIKSFNGNKEEVNLEVPYDPERIAVLDMASLDILDNLGMGDRVVGSASTSLEYLTDYVDNEEVANLGTIKEADLEAVMECDPDVIFIGGRLASSYDALSEIAPVVFLSTESELGIVKSVTKNAETIASMFGLEDEVSKKTEGFDERIKALKKTAEGKTALVGMTTSGSFNLMGNDGRCSIVGREVGFENLTAAESTSTHGNEASFETVVEKNPDYIFVWTEIVRLVQTGHRPRKKLWRMNLSWEQMHIRMDGLSIWNIQQCGIQQKGGSQHLTLCFLTWRMHCKRTKAL